MLPYIIFMFIYQICKKQKANPSPVTFQHYKDGEYSADYDRKFSVKVSQVLFLCILCKYI